MQSLIDEAKALAEAGAFRDLIPMLGRLSNEDEQAARRLGWAAQGAWLAPKLKGVPPAEVRAHYENLFVHAVEYTELRRRIACELMWNALPGGAEPADAEAAANASQACRIAAEAEGIQTQDDFTLWLNNHLQVDRKQNGEAIRQAIDELVADGWLFDRTRI